MSFDNSFSEDDAKKFVEFMNSVAKHATFNMTTQQMVEHVRALGHMQNVIAPKIQNHILEVKEVVEDVPVDKAEDSEGES